MSGRPRRLAGVERFDHLAHTPDETADVVVGPVWSTRGSYRGRFGLSGPAYPLAIPGHAAARNGSR